MSLVYLTHLTNILFCSLMAYMLLGRRRVLSGTMQSILTKIFGEQSASRQLFGATYLAIVVASLFAFFWRENFIEISLLVFSTTILYTFSSASMLRPAPHPLAVYNILLMMPNLTGVIWIIR